VRAAGTSGETARHHLSQSGERTLHARLERQRGLKSFLTWAFFLAQLSAAEQLLTGAAKAQQDEPSDSAANRAEESPSDPSAENAIHKSVGGGAMEAIASPPSSSSTIQIPSMDDITSMPPHPHLSSPATSSAPSITGAAGGSASGSAAHARVGSSGRAESSLPDLLPDHDSVDQVAPGPVHADTGLNSLLGFDLNLDADGLISTNIDLDLGNVVGNLGDLLVTPLQEVTEIVDSLTDGLGTLLSGTGLALGDALDSALDLSELTGLNLTDGLSGLLGEDSTEPAEQDGETAASTTGGLLDDLFADGRYTNYNIALHDSAEPVVDIDITLSSEPTTADVAPSEPPQADQPPLGTAIADLLPFDELETRPPV
jgi:hypothetical protein